jgi:hypothetical protein
MCLRPMNKLLSAIIAALLCTVAMAAQAKETQEEQPIDWYDIEVIIFSHHDLNALTHEKWKRDPGTPDIRSAKELLPPLPENLSKAHSEKLKAPLAYLQLREDQYQLNDKFEQLQEAKGYDPLIHIAWRQPGLGPDDAVAVHIHGGVNGTAAAKEDDEGEGAATEAPPAEAVETPATEELADTGVEGPPAPFIDGTIKLIRKRFLHVEADFLYRAPYIDDPANRLTREQWPQAFRLTESRRMRSRELHYLDHPMFGILIIATPYEPPEPPAEEATTTAVQKNPKAPKRILQEKDPLSGTIRR